jgi:hypothetical protein
VTQNRLNISHNGFGKFTKGLRNISIRVVNVGAEYGLVGSWLDKSGLVSRGIGSTGSVISIFG